MYAYDDMGNLVSTTDQNGTKMTYDKANNMGRETLTNGRTIDYYYDNSDNVEYIIDSLLGKYTYTYDNDDHVLTESYPNSQKVSFNENGGLASISTSLYNLNYTYDDNGNIVTIMQDDKPIVGYQYNAYNELIRENTLVQNETITYSYDKNGNMLKKSVYPYSLGTLGTVKKVTNYQYDNSSDPAELTNYNGKEVKYDSKGNITSYNNTLYSWNASNLTQVKNAKSKVTFDYDSNGVRSDKYVNGKKVTYTTDSDNKVVEQTYGNNITKFIYDDNDILAAIVYNGNTFYYEKNAQNDIIGIYDSNKQEVVTYQYDSWGNLLSISGSLAKTLGIDNPFRYRSYYYDNETGLYYLGSRYYSPQFSRFLSKDDASFHENSTDIDANLYIYCVNNPINMFDDSGFKQENISLFSLYTAKSQLPWYTRMKSIYSEKYALQIIGKYSSAIKTSSEKYQIPSQMIDSILFREIICFGIDDIVADAAVRSYYSGGPKIRKDSSTGLGQIFAATAIESEKNILGYNTVSTFSLYPMWIRLQNDKVNINYVSIVLKSGANSLQLPTIDKNEYSQIQDIFSTYNNAAYGKAVIMYYKVFLKYWS